LLIFLNHIDYSRVRTIFRLEAHIPVELRNQSCLDSQLVPVDFPAQPKRLNIKKRRGCVIDISRGRDCLGQKRNEKLTEPSSPFSEAAFGKQLYELLKSTIGLNFRQIDDMI
jgi:hypothetical protein